MQLKFRIILNVKEDVLRDIVIDSSTSLIEFSNIISTEFGFDSSEISTFHKTDDNWEQLEEIKIFKIDDKDEIMDNIPISNFFILKNDKLIFIYDFLNYWTFFIDVNETVEKAKDREYPFCLLSVGKVPEESPTNIFLDNPDIDLDSNSDLS